MFWEDMAKGGAEGLLKGVGTFAKDLRTAITGDEPLSAEQKTRLVEQASAIEAAALNADVAQMQGQVEINKIEAGSDSFFKSGWRPGLGWICCSAFAYSFLLRPILPWLVDSFGFVVQPMPALNMDELLFLTSGMLGLGGFRTYEKVRSMRNG